MKKKKNKGATNVKDSKHTNKTLILEDMPREWKDKLLSVMRVQTNSENEKLMILFLDKYLRTLGIDYTIDAAGNMLITKGKADTYPCVISHMDTVHNFEEGFEIYHMKDDKDKWIAQDKNGHRAGIGGDDKCGVFTCLYFLETMPDIKVAFFSREETGCCGSKAVDHSFFKNCRYIIQPDRKGGHDFIKSYAGKTTISDAFSSEIGKIKKKYGYKNDIGTVTDCMKLWDHKVGVSCCNVSAGYYRPHSINEYISVKEVWNCIKFIEETIYTLKPHQYRCLPPKTVDVVHRNENTYYNTRNQCDMCHKYYYSTYEYNGLLVCWSCKNYLQDKEEKKQTTGSTASKTGTTIIKTTETGYRCFHCKGKLVKGAMAVLRNKHYYCKACADKLDKENFEEYLGKDTTNLDDIYCDDCKYLLLATDPYYITIANRKLCVVCGIQYHPSMIKIAPDIQYYCPRCERALLEDETVFRNSKYYVGRTCKTCQAEVIEFDDLIKQIEKKWKIGDD